MDTQPKRRVLSLSLSQTAKQNKKLKLKRNASTSSEKGGRNATCEGSLKLNSLRNDTKICVVESNRSTSEAAAVLFAHYSECDKRDSLNHTTTNGQVKKAGETQPSIEPKVQSQEGLASLDSAEGEVTVHRLKRSETDVQDECNSSSNTELKPVVGNETAYGRKLIEKIPLKDQSCNSPGNIFEGHVWALNKRTGLKSSLATDTMISSDTSSICNLGQTGLVEEESCTVECNPSATVTESSNEKLIPSNMPNKSINTDAVTINTEKECLDILQCPLCYKNFDKLATKTTHLKSCASKHKISTQQLLEALELQQRQVAERKALGLPGVLRVLEKSKKLPMSKKETCTISKMDSNLQLAMALSLSLQEQEQTVGDSRNSEPSKVVSLDHFRFTNKSVLDSLHPRPSTSSSLSRGKPKGLKKTRPILLTRTDEERQRIVTEKAAMVLMEEENPETGDKSKPVYVNSSFLQECWNEETSLWEKSHTSPSNNDRKSYYVQSLRSFISPSKVEMGSKVMHLSQVAGRVKTPTKVQGQPEVVSAYPSDEEISSGSSHQQQNESKDPSHIEMELRAKLFNDWASMVNNSTMSDVTIYPQEGRDIPAHKIILHVRCSLILQDICKQRNLLTGNEVEVIMWSKIPHVAALAFLEYIYCGSVKSIRVISEDLSSILWLANHYKVADLIRYLHVVSECTQVSQTASQVALSVVKDLNDQFAEPKTCQDGKKNCIKPQSENITLTGKERSVIGSCRQFRSSTDIFASPVGTPRSETESIYSEATLAGAENCNSCSSPDIFCDEDEVKSPEIFVEERQCSDMTMGMTDNQSKQLLTNYKSACDNVNGQRPPSRSASVSSEKTVIIEKNPCSASPCASVSSEKTVLFDNISPPLSPVHSNTSAVSEVRDFSQSGSSRPSSSINDSKRKHSDSSQQGAASSSKRPCHISSTPGPQSEKKDSDVEIFDLTQDSDSGSLIPTVANKLSGYSCDQICISSGNENSDNEVNNETPNDAACDQRDSLNRCYFGEDSKSNAADKTKRRNEEVRCSIPEVMEEPYVSPVWDGFEDLNHDDPYLFDVGNNADSQPKVTAPTDPVAPTSSPPQSDIESLFSGGEINESLNKENHEEKNRTIDGESSNGANTRQHPSVFPRISKRSTSTSFDALLDESLNIDDSILRQAENGLHETLTQRGTKGTPVNRVLSSEPDGVTPVANYSAMKTPELKRELQKFGLKPTLGKRKGKLMLRHIYNELHPWVPAESERVQERVTLSQPSHSRTKRNERDSQSSSQPNSRRLSFSNSDSDSESVENDSDPIEKECGSLDPNSDSSSGSSSDSDSNNRSMSRHEIKYLEGNRNDTQAKKLKRVSKDDVLKVVTEFIRNGSVLQHKVLQYEPIWIDALQMDLRSSGYRIKMQDLMAALDERCITFRSAPSGPRVRRRKPKRGDLLKKTAAGELSD